MQVAKRFPEIPREHFDTAVQLIELDGAVCAGAEAVFRALAKNPKRQWPLRIYESSPTFGAITERAYRFVAGHRTGFSRLTRWFWGKHLEPRAQVLTRWFFLRALGLVYLVAFVSLWSQISGLIGHDGILPADQVLPAMKQHYTAQGVGWERFYLMPTLSWFDVSDGFLHFQCAVGAGLAILLIIGIAPVPCLALLWLFYLSLVTVGLDFLGFQWDNLLLEAGFLVIFFAPLQWLPRRLSREAPPSRLVLWLLRLLLFKLMFSSGCVKLLSGDPNWRNLTALTFHYYTQPLPTWMAWYANQLPLWFQKSSCATMFAIELGAPWLMFGLRRIRFLGAAALIFLQILILLTGNYTFFNWLTLALCLLLLDDFALQNIFQRGAPGAVPARAERDAKRAETVLGAPKRPRWPRVVIIPMAIIILSASGFQLAATLGFRSPLLHPFAWVAEQLAPLRTVNNYGLFAVMTTERREIIVEGSNDGTNWLAYEFKYKPGDVDRCPAFIAPFQPRLDWQMWFAALRNVRQNPWFVNFCERLLQGSPDVLALLARDPFPDKPPRYIRAELYDYHFTNFSERRATGAWWTRKYIGEYLPPISLRE